MRKVFRVGIKRSIEKIKLFDTGDNKEYLAKNLPNLIFTGNKEVHIEGLKSIIEYTENLIKLNLGKGYVTFLGNDLSINALVDGEITVYGNIDKVEFE